MTVINTTDTIREVGNGVKVAFTFPFKIFLTSDLDVFKIDTDVAPEVATLQVEGVDYTVAINTVTEGGTVTYVVAPTTSPQEDSFIGRNLALNQLTDIPREANFPEESIENEFDRSRMIDIQQQTEIDLHFGYGATSSFTNTVVPDPFADFMLGWDPTGQFMVNIDPNVVGAVSAADAAASAAAASVSEGNASTSEGNTSTSEGNASASAAAAAASAASINLPTIQGGDVGKILEVNVAEDGYDLVVPAAGGSNIEVEDEGGSLTTAVTLFNFVGAGVTVTEPTADEVLVTIPGGAGPSAFRQSFVNGDLTAGVISINHALGEQYSQVQVFNNSDKLIIPDDVTMTDANNLSLDLTGFGTIAGTWNIVVIG